MHFNNHFRLQGKHAFLSASKYSWIRYDDEKLISTWLKSSAAQRGTELHAFASEAIRLGIKLTQTNKTLNLYVNDCIGYRMTPELLLYYSDNIFGTADAVAFRNQKLRISDLKTGVNPGSVDQLLIYAALFCLEYKFNAFEIQIELRIYQNDEVKIFDADPDEVTHIMAQIKHFDALITRLREEELS